MDQLRLLVDSESGGSCPQHPFPSELFMNQHCRLALQAQQQLDIKSVSVLEISVQLFATDAMQQLNQQYRQKDVPTNVLSFESGLPALITDDGKTLLSLGDLVLCPDVIALEAQQQSKKWEDHWAHLLVHGTLHLCGFDHQESVQASVMESLEVQILSGSGIADPYQVHCRS